MPAKLKPTKECDCLERLRVFLKGQYGPVDLQLKMYFKLHPEEGEESSRLGLPPLFFTFHRELPNGKRDKKTTRGHIKFSYCPFCGIKIP